MRTVIAHGHIFKNAGTTFDWALEKNFGKSFCDHREDKPMRQQGASYLTQYLLDNPQINAISSHHLCETSTIDEIDIIPVFLLRHPIERILSVYTFEREQKSSSPGAKAAKKYNFKDYVQWRMDPEVNRTIRNYQTSYLAGDQTRKTSKACTLNVFNAALNKAQHNYTTTEKELLAIVLCLKEYRKIIYGAVMNVYTNHKNLTFNTFSIQ